ncbi:protein rep [Helicobacter felistomachi]|uniref:protein rep n=1 Tax=Helicobacter felistomachi TaxID=3040201 RepID=UPI00336A0ACD
MRSSECGHFLTFDKYRNKESDELVRILAWASFCGVRWCPMCAWRKARKLVMELLSILSQIECDYRVGYTLPNPHDQECASERFTRVIRPHV